MGKAGDYSCYKVEEDEADVAHPVFDVVSEDPEIEHIPCDVQKSAMNEHRREECEWDGDESRWIEVFKVCYLVRDGPRHSYECELLQSPHGQLEDEDKKVYGYDYDGNEGEGICGIVVFKRDHEMGTVYTCGAT